MRTWRVNGGNLQRDVEEEVAGERARRLWDQLRPQHWPAVPRRLCVDFDLDALLLGRRCCIQTRVSSNRSLHERAPMGTAEGTLHPATYWRGS